jgi:hypothetical protein
VRRRCGPERSRRDCGSGMNRTSRAAGLGARKWLLSIEILVPASGESAGRGQHAVADPSHLNGHRECPVADCRDAATDQERGRAYGGSCISKPGNDFRSPGRLPPLAPNLNCRLHRPRAAIPNSRWRNRALPKLRAPKPGQAGDPMECLSGGGTSGPSLLAMWRSSIAGQGN